MGEGYQVSNRYWDIIFWDMAQRGFILAEELHVLM